ncbi:MAG: DUF362 domain-containing protein [Deltaproteobacteria bacterium]|nr:DUF362 domain-containing protein [Deltaproteobacteria bacterium]
MKKVLIHPATYENVREAVNRAFAVFPLELRDRRVLIKPNVLRASEAAEGIVTHPAVLRAVVEKVKTLSPASVVVGDNPGLFSYGANEEAFRTTGLLEAAGGCYENIGNDASPVPFNPEFAAEVSVSRAVLEADVLISLPKFKTHGLTVVSGAIKNSYGLLPGAQKARLHKAAGTPERFHRLVVDVFRLRVPDLFIVDAVVGMEGNGPASPDLREVGVLLASDNAVALDAVIAGMMGLDPARLGFLRHAKEAGLGEYDRTAIEILGEFRTVPDFRLPPLGGEAVMQNEGLQALLQQRLHLRPRATPDACTGCGTCVEQCPVSALALEGGLPVADPNACIACFCCQELCPEKAIALV